LTPHVFFLTLPLKFVYNQGKIVADLKWYEEPLEPMDEDRAREIISKVIKSPNKRLIGLEPTSELAAVGLFSGIPYSRDDWKDVGPGHILFSEVPGTGKTDLARTMAESIDSRFSFIACHPEMKHSDLFGGDMLNKQTGNFFRSDGPVYAHILLEDEANRASPKTQSFTLQIMEERVAITSQISTTLQKVVNMVRPLFPVKDGSGRTIFWVLATVNPVEQEGTYPIPEAQLDRFMLRLRINSLTREQEMTVRATNLQNPFGSYREAPKIEKVTNPAEVYSIIRFIGRNITPIEQTPKVNGYMQSLVENTRPFNPNRPVNPDRPDATSELKKYIDKHVKIDGGLSTRANIYYEAAVRTLAFFRKKKQITANELRDLAVPALAHRLQLKSSTKGLGITQEDVIRKVLEGTKPC